jgi:hypothetical protein
MQGAAVPAGVVTFAVTCVFIALADTYANAVLDPIVVAIAESPVVFVIFMFGLVGRAAVALPRPSPADRGGPTRASGVYWRVVSPVIHCAWGRLTVVWLLIALAVFAPGYLPDGPLSFNFVP